MCNCGSNSHSRPKGNHYSVPNKTEGTSSMLANRAMQDQRTRQIIQQRAIQQNQKPRKSYR